MEDVIIRSAKPEDWKTIQQLNAEVIVANINFDTDGIVDFSSTPAAIVYYQAVVSEPRYVCLIAEVQNQPIGYIAGSERVFSYRKSRYLELLDMGVSPNFRSTGVGTKLFQAFREWASKHGFQRIFVSAYSKNLQAISFYKQNGFEEIGLELECTV